MFLCLLCVVLRSFVAILFLKNGRERAHKIAKKETQKNQCGSAALRLLQSHGNGRALANSAGRGDVAVHGLNQVLDNRQA